MRPRSLKPPLPSRPSWWLEEARAFRPEAVSPPLAGTLDVDVAVVGGGYTGLWTALALRERDPSLSVAAARGTRDRRRAERPQRRLPARLLVVDRDAPRGARRRRRAPARACVEPDRPGRARVPRAARRGRLAARGRAAEGRGDRGRGRGRSRGRCGRHASSASRRRRSRSTARRVRRRLDSPRFRRGVFFRDGAIVQPARLALALKRAALAAGVQLFEHTPVTTVQPGTDRDAGRQPFARARSCSR